MAYRYTAEEVERHVRDELARHEHAVDWLNRRYGADVCRAIIPQDRYREELKTWFREEFLSRCRDLSAYYPEMPEKVYNLCKRVAKTMADAEKDEADALRDECMRWAKAEEEAERLRREAEVAVEITPAEVLERASAEIQAELEPYEDIERYIEEKHGGNACWLIATHPPGWVRTVFSEWRKDVADACRAILKSYGREAYRECVGKASYIADIARSRLSELYEACRPKRRSLLARAMGW
jgi:hypothetical protein